MNDESKFSSVNGLFLLLDACEYTLSKIAFREESSCVEMEAGDGAKEPPLAEVIIASATKGELWQGGHIYSTSTDPTLFESWSHSK